MRVGEILFVSCLAFLWRVSSKAKQPEGFFFVAVLFLVCGIKESITSAGFYVRKNVRERQIFPAFFFFDLKENQSNLPSDKISSTSFNQEAFRKCSALIINSISLYFNSTRHLGQTKHLSCLS